MDDLRSQYEPRACQDSQETPPQQSYPPPDQGGYGTQPPYDATPAPLALAGIGARFLALLVDGFIITVVFGILFGGLAIFLGVGLSASQGNEGAEFLAVTMMYGLIGLLYLGMVLYYVLMECSPLQATLGKMMVGIQVVDGDGERISFLRSLGRNLMKIFISGQFCFIGYIVAFFTEKKQSLHDLVASTYVVNKHG
ncbi:MAG: RDD family protein [Planctomycetota bacterium]|nr:RDD family protein [Planctomycetota bacterium]